jgi:polycomb protein EED
MVNFKFVGSVKEEHNQPLFGVKFNPFLPDKRIFATVGSNRATIYQCDTPGGPIAPLQCYVDADSDENFYTCAWCPDDDNGAMLLAVGGVKGIIRILNTITMKCDISFIGHGNAVNELQVHPKDHNLLLSASKDYALRLWNIKTAICVVIFGGVEGHRDEVLSIDFNLDGTLIYSAGMDHALKIWNLDTDEYRGVVAKSYSHTKGSFISFSILKVHFPLFSSREVHRNYIDCIRSFGKFAISKSCENNFTLWRPPHLTTGSDRMKKSFEILQKYEVPNCEIWYIRFDIDCKFKVRGITFIISPYVIVIL